MPFNITSNCDYIYIYQDALDPVPLLKSTVVVAVDGDIVQITSGSTHYYINYFDTTITGTSYVNAVDTAATIQEYIDYSCTGTGYSTWEGSISQYSQDAPVVNLVYLNELPDDIVWTRNGSGAYLGYCQGAFLVDTVAHTTGFIGSDGISMSIWYITRYNDDNVQLTVVKTYFNPRILLQLPYTEQLDELIDFTQIIIKVKN